MGHPDDSPSAAPPLPPSATQEVATRRFEHYEVLLREDDGELWKLGSGAMGVTYKARDTRLHCAVALKVVNAALLAKYPAARERFLREARAAAQLRHPNVASVFHLGETPTGECFYAMEFIEGETLESRVRRRGPLPVHLALEVTAQVSRALIAASQQGLVHRDLKPANLMLVSPTHRESICSDDGTSRPGDSSGSGSGSEPGEIVVKVIDFGLAKAVTDGGELTGFGNFLGTPHFASPEQFAGAGDPLDSRSDIFSLGVTLWFLLTGGLPFPGRSLDEIHLQHHRDKLPVGQLVAARVPPAVIALLESMLAAEPADRPQTPYALAEALRRCRGVLTSVVARDTAGAKKERARGSASEVGRRKKAETRKRGVARQWATVVAILGIGAALLGVVLFYSSRTKPGTATTKAAPVSTPTAVPGMGIAPLAEKSIAVLPFENLSDDKENAFFADGIQDDLLTSLAKIGELKVISRTSVLPYRGGAARNLREIGKALGVAHILEGSVRRAGARVRVSVQLIDARADRQEWAETFDRDLTNVLSLQSELAKEIASTLRATLSPQEKAGLERKPTENSDAYVLFLRGRELQTRPDILLEYYQGAERMYEQAVASDADFALAHARLSLVRSQIGFNYEPSPARKAQARASAERALRLRPDLAEAHLALGYCLYWGEGDYVRAIAEFEQAMRASPSDPEAPRAIANIRRRQGRWDEARAGFERSLALSPRDLPLTQSLARLHYDRREWQQAAETLDRALALAPESLSDRLWRAFLEFHWKGELEPVKRALANVPAGQDPEGIVTFQRFETAWIERDYAAAENVLTASPLETFPLGISTPIHKRYLLGLLALAAGRKDSAAAARAHLEAARPHYEAAVQGLPQDALRRADLGLVYAALGWKEAAVAEGQRAVALCPESKDALYGTTTALRLAKIYAQLGDAEGALPILEHLLTVPVHEGVGFSINDLRRRPEWDGLRADARFQKLLASAGK